MIQPVATMWLSVGTTVLKSMPENLCLHYYFLSDNRKELYSDIVHTQLVVLQLQVDGMCVDFKFNPNPSGSCDNVVKNQGMCFKKRNRNKCLGLGNIITTCS